MLKKFIIFIFLALLTNCSGPGTAFLGPTFTGVKTGSVYQTSLSYGSSKAINIVKNSVREEIVKNGKLSLTNDKNNENHKLNSKNLPVLLAIKIDLVEVSEPLVEEPLP